MRGKRWMTILTALTVMSTLLCGCGAGKKTDQKSEETDNRAETEFAETTQTTAEPEAGTEQAEPEETKADEEQMQTEEQNRETDKTEVPCAEIVIRDYGTIRVQLEPEEAPETVKNFISLAESGFYDGLTFHRIIDGFMMQGGDPLGNGTGGAEQTIRGEFAMNGVENSISHTKGVISMARSQDPDSASSQFFIVQSDSTFLDGQYAGFGHVTEGLEIVDQICADARPVDNNGTIPLDAQPVMESVRIIYTGNP